MLTDTHFAVLELLKAGQPLTAKTVHRRTYAKIGPERIPIQIVADLERANMIHCRQVDQFGAHHGRTRHFEYVKGEPDPDFVLHPLKRAKRVPRPSQEAARREVLAAWHAWWSIRELAAQTAKDADAHDFLRHLKAQKPMLFTFHCGGKNPYEVAFSWLVDAAVLGFEESKQP